MALESKSWSRSRQRRSSPIFRKGMTARGIKVDRRVCPQHDVSKDVAAFHICQLVCAVCLLEHKRERGRTWRIIRSCADGSAVGCSAREAVLSGSPVTLMGYSEASGTS